MPSETATLVRDRPILFSGTMVRAILDGRKTQTRRVIRDQPMKHPGGKYEPHDPFVHADGMTWGWMSGVVSYTDNDCRCPYGRPGDRLWVRETWATPSGRIVAYAADGECGAWMDDGDGGGVWLRHGGVFDRRVPPRGPEWRGESYGLARYGGRWRPSIHMPRWASRLTLDVTDVRVERVQQMTIADARAEGITEYGEGFGREGDDVWRNRTSVENFAERWDALNAKRGFGWDVNPWVWVIEFPPVGGAERKRTHAAQPEETSADAK